MDIRGLSDAEVAERIARGQVNRAPDTSWAEYREIVLRNVVTLFNALVVPAAVALFLLGEYRGAWAVSAMALINTLIGLVQEIRTKHHLDKLALLTYPKARVLRDGAEQHITASEVVLDDVVLIAPGEAVIADGTLLAVNYLEVDEALLTGESDPVLRQAGERLLSGSLCVAGDGVYRVTKVGSESYAHQTAAQARRYQYSPSPLQHTLNVLIQVLTAVAISLCLLYVALYYMRGFSAAELWQMIAATVTSMVPQGLVLMTTLTFTLGAVRMQKRGALVQRLDAIESMASLDVLCMDKTGTLTTNQFQLVKIRPLKGDEAEARRMLQLFAWTSIDERNKSIQAIRAALGAMDVKAELIEQLPFKSQNRYSAVRVRQGNDEWTLVLGATETLLHRMSAENKADVDAHVRELLPSGLRLLVFAQSTKTGVPLDGALSEGSLTPIAVVALSDELRPDAGDVVNALAEQGIRFKIISGDNPETVHATVRPLGLGFAEETVATGDDFESAADRGAWLEEHSVFGRVNPKQKLDIIAALQKRKYHVGMIGDGINDVLAIKRSNLGIAMGAGTSATKTVAALVLQNNQFALLPETLDEGRLILWNLQRAAKLFLLKNVFTLVLIVVLLGILGADFPYRAQQVTLLNLLTIGGPAFLIMLGRQRATMRLLSGRRGFLREAALYAIPSGLVTGAAALSVWLTASSWASDGVETRRALLLTTLILIGLGNVLLIAEGDRRLFAWSAAALVVYLVVLNIPPLAHFFELAPLAASQWLCVALVGLVALSLCVLARRLALHRAAPLHRSA
jgi:cation-transporting ATPase E